MNRRALAVVVGITVAICVVAFVLYYTLLLPKRGQWALEIYVDGSFVAGYTVEELSEMAQVVYVPDYERNCTMVPLWDLLQNTTADPDEVLVKSIKAVGSDGYSRTIRKGEYKIGKEAWFYLKDTYVRIVEEEYVADEGPLRFTVLGLSHTYWVKFLARIEVETAGWGLTVLKSGIGWNVLGFFTLSDLAAMPKVSISIGEETLEVINLTEVLSRCGLSISDVEGLTLMAYDGYMRDVEGQYAPHCYIWIVPDDLVPEKGRLRAIIPDLSKRYWVHHLIAIEVST